MRKISYKYLTAALLGVLMMSCGNDVKKDEAVAPITIGVMASMDYLPIAVAQANKYFEEEGVVVKIQKFYSANDRDAALQSNNLDGTIIDYTGAAIQKAGGVDLSFTSQCDGTFELIAGKDVEIKNDNDYIGKSFAISRNTVIDFCTDMLLKDKGIPLDKVKESEINKIPLRLEMLRNGKIDMTVLPDPFATMAKADGGQVLNSLQNIDYFITGIVFLKKSILEKEQSIRAFYKAYNRAVADLQEKPIDSFHKILVEEIGFPEAMLANVKLPNYEKARKPRNKDLQAVSDWLTNRKLITEDFDIFKMVESSELWNK
ncbi:MAG TPA: ABC transporter substrate-binding protein [Edaphocola sp.]|nr:ABC transporter substrate-binding protein [Edaphocola sp.]